MTKKAIVEEVLLAIYEEDGVLLPQSIVDRARERSHPLHAHFEWDNKKAGEQFRLLQASQMIRQVEVKITTADESYRVRAFHPMRYVDREGPGYVRENDIEPVERPVLLQTMRREWMAMRRRYGHMAEFWQMVGAEQETKVG